MSSREAASNVRAAAAAETRVDIEPAEFPSAGRSPVTVSLWGKALEVVSLVALATLVPRLLGPVDYGEFTLAVSLVAVGSLSLSLGGPAMVARFIPAVTAPERPRVARALAIRLGGWRLGLVLRLPAAPGSALVRRPRPAPEANLGPPFRAAPGPPRVRSPSERMAKQMSPLPDARSVRANPTPDELKELAARMPNARRTRYDNLNVQTQVLARSKASTFIIADDPKASSQQAIPREEGERIARLQDEYIADRDMLIVDGYIGDDPDFRIPARLYIEEANANIAAMQRQLYFDLDEGDGFEPELTVIYTPNLAVAGYPNDRVITVDLERGVTRVCNSDYFGESKKGGLRMWNKLVYDRGGLPLHAGCKVIPTDAGDKIALIVGLSGTGKTTTTFTRQNGSLPVQDDFVAMMPGGKVYATEAGCFAKTFALSAEDEPTIYGAVTRPEAYLENVSQDDRGELDFFDESYTQNGRATFAFSAIESAPAADLQAADFLLILNRNENIIPAVAKLDARQAAAYFMLGETQGTSAGGAEEAGKNLRVPGTNPFFPDDHDHQGNRFLELMGEHELDVYLMNTGSVGGPAGDDRARKVRIPHSSAIVKGIAEGTIEWQEDPDFGYAVARHVPGIEGDDEAVLRPRELYEAQGRSDEYARLVDRLKQEREEFLRGFPALSDEIIAAVR
jgi:phosphoenolpyruvate carboxykinase (ATP)